MCNILLANVKCAWFLCSVHECFICEMVWLRANCHEFYFQCSDCHCQVESTSSKLNIRLNYSQFDSSTFKHERSINDIFVISDFSDSSTRLSQTKDMITSLYISEFKLFNFLFGEIGVLFALVREREREEEKSAETL